LESKSDSLNWLPKPEVLCPGIVFLFGIFLYSWTLAPTVTLVDSGELILAARSLGVAHPPGFPLYVMLAHLASLVPIGNVAQRINFASAVFAALASAMTTLLMIELIRTSSIMVAARKRKKRVKQGKASGQVESSYLMFVPAIATGLSFSCFRTLWSYGTIAEVYTLNTLLIVSIIWLMFRWRRHIITDQRWKDSKFTPPICNFDWLLYTAAGLFGLALGVHHVTVALILPALAILVWKTQSVRFFTSKRLLFAALISFLGLVAVYSYLPLAAARSPIMNWGKVDSLTTVWWHITGRQYQVFLSFNSKIMGQELVTFGRFLVREFGYWWLPVTPALALIGLSGLFKQDRAAFWFLLTIILADMAYGVSYFIAEDKDAYYLPTFISIAIAAGFGLYRLLSWVPPTKAPWTAAISAALLPTLALVANWPFNNRRHDFIAQDYIENMLASVEPNGLLLTLDWQVASPFFYTQEIESHRRDVKVVDINLLRRSWYFDYLQRTHPELISRSQDKVDTFLAELRQWERNPDVYAKNAQLTEKIDTAFQELLHSLIRNELRVAPVYLTHELLFQTEGQDKEVTQWITRNYQPFPNGLLFKLETDHYFHDPGELHLQTRGLNDGTLKFEPDDVVRQRVLPAYRSMLINRGRYCSIFGRQSCAIEAFLAALALDPTLQEAQQGLEDSMRKAQNPSAP